MLTHLDSRNNPTMVDISKKAPTIREACAEVEIYLPKEIRDIFHNNELHSKKGPVLQTAIIGATMAVKKTSELIPFCHPIPIEKIKFEYNIFESDLKIRCFVLTEGKTGVEMEALQGVTQAALIVYDMCKAITHDIIIKKTQLLSKSGGKREFLRFKDDNP